MQIWPFYGEELGTGHKTPTAICRAAESRPQGWGGGPGCFASGLEPMMSGLGPGPRLLFRRSASCLLMWPLGLGWRLYVPSQQPRVHSHTAGSQHESVNVLSSWRGYNLPGSMPSPIETAQRSLYVSCHCTDEESGSGELICPEPPTEPTRESTSLPTLPTFQS